MKRLAMILAVTFTMGLASSSVFATSKDNTKKAETTTCTAKDKKACCASTDKKACCTKDAKAAATDVKAAPAK
jgi:hypothetical protein